MGSRAPLRSRLTSLMGRSLVPRRAPPPPDLRSQHARTDRDGLIRVRHVTYLVELPGHVGLALVFTAPVWLALPRSAAAVFTALAVPASMLPDVDLVVPWVHHHGPTHTLLFAVVASVALGALVAGLDELLRDDGPPRGVERSVLEFSAAAFFVGAGSHVLTDMLSAPDIAEPVEPFWPLWQGSVGVDLLYFSSTLSNFGLLAVGVAAHLAVFAVARRRRPGAPTA